MSAASKAKREALDIEVAVFEKGDWISYGACGLPYYVKGDVELIEELRKSFAPNDQTKPMFPQSLCEK